MQELLPAKLTLPEQTHDDTTHAIWKGFVGLVPVIGPFAAELFGCFVPSQYSEAMRQWMLEVSEALHARVDLKELEGNPDFVPFLLRATQAAMKTRDDEKRKALLNALRNVGLRRSPPEDEQSIFVKLVDDFTSWHVRLLRFFQEPDFVAGSISAGLHQTEALATVAFRLYPELRSRSALFRQIVRDLRAAGLIEITSEDVNKRKGGVLFNGRGLSWTTELGDQFLAFIGEIDQTPRKLSKVRSGPRV